MQMRRVTEAALFAIGMAFLALSYRASHAPLVQISAASTSHYGHRTAWVLALGTAGAAGGSPSFAIGRHR